MAHHKRIATLRNLGEKAGLELIEFQSKQPHLVTALFLAPDRKSKRLFSIPIREGDPRGDLNELQRMKQFARECPIVNQMTEALKPLVQEFKHVRISEGPGAAGEDEIDRRGSAIVDLATRGYEADQAPPDAAEGSGDGHSADARVDQEDARSTGAGSEQSAQLDTPAAKLAVSNPPPVKTMNSKKPVSLGVGRTSSIHITKVAVWLATQKELPHSMNALCARASEAVGFVVGEKLMTGVLAGSGRQLPKRPAGRPRKNEVAGLSAARILATNLVNVMTGLGIEVPADLKELTELK